MIPGFDSAQAHYDAMEPTDEPDEIEESDPDDENDRRAEWERDAWE